ncbi:hypothetical protein FA743_18645 [Paracoccus gahaiensis]|uniref:SH3b domain-containing protein n=1 Tax=Paracoccus gahaiensis TaxID=1706839 RepID=A0A4U0R5H1_9RHOB|nr:SH3 domain-containing protein [Paracoccus gahaiensis]TJZ89472.1 hypothetical protein FA743_18645 [Paracoccus gahaiensis]
MIRLGLLILATLTVLVLALWQLGDGAAPERAPVTPSSATMTPQPAESDPPAPAAPLAPEAPSGIVPAASQTPEQAPRFPGPPLEPSPEFAEETPAPDLPPGEAGATLYVTATRVNMRSGPGTDNPVVTGLDGGTAVEALGPLGGEWMQIRAPSGQEGFVSGQFLSTQAP